MSEYRRISLPGYEGIYDIDSNGVIYSINQSPQWQRKNPTGALRVGVNRVAFASLSRGNETSTKKKCIPIAKTVLELFGGRKLKKSETIRYKDGDRLNCALDNLEVVLIDRKKTYEESLHITELKYLTKKEKERIVQLFLSGRMTRDELAIEFVVHKDLIKYLTKGMKAKRGSLSYEDEYGILDDDSDEDDED